MYSDLIVKVKTVVCFPGVTSQMFKRRRTCYDFDKFPERELFYWAILFNRKDLAKIFWKGGQDQLGIVSVVPAFT